LPDAVRSGQRDDLATPQRERLSGQDARLRVAVADLLEATELLARAVASGTDRLHGQVVGPVRREPLERVFPAAVEQDPPVFEEEHAVAALERKRGALLDDDDRATELAGKVEQRRRGIGVDLRRGLVEQEQVRFEREDGRE